MASNWIIVFGCCCIFIGENGSGFIWFFLCLIVGLVVKGFENGWFEEKTYVQPKDFWKETFIRELHSSNCNGSVECAVNRADLITRGNSCPVPSQEEKNRIVAFFGYETKEAANERDFKEELLNVYPGEIVNKMYDILREKEKQTGDFRYGNFARQLLTAKPFKTALGSVLICPPKGWRGIRYENWKDELYKRTTFEERRLCEDKVREFIIKFKEDNKRVWGEYFDSIPPVDECARKMREGAK